MAKLGYHVLLIERLKFGRMNREWNISREEFQVLIDNGLFTKKKNLNQLLRLNIKTVLVSFLMPIILVI